MADWKGAAARLPSIYPWAKAEMPPDKREVFRMDLRLAADACALMAEAPPTEKLQELFDFAGLGDATDAAVETWLRSLVAVPAPPTDTEEAATDG